MSLLHDEFHEVWWVYAPERHPWGGLRVANFRKTMDGTLYFFIAHEPADRAGPRVWDDVAEREGWVKVKRIELPTKSEIEIALHLAIRNIVQEIKTENGFT